MDPKVDGPNVGSADVRSLGLVGVPVGSGCVGWEAPRRGPHGRGLEATRTSLAAIQSLDTKPVEGNSHTPRLVGAPSYGSNPAGSRGLVLPPASAAVARREVV